MLYQRDNDKKLKEIYNRAVGWLGGVYNIFNISLIWRVSARRRASTRVNVNWLSRYLVQFIALWPYSSGTRQQPGIWSDQCNVYLKLSFRPKKLFIAYTEDIDNVFYNGLHHHCFADDTQMYITTPRSDTHTIAPRLQKCIADVSDW